MHIEELINKDCYICYACNSAYASVSVEIVTANYGLCSCCAELLIEKTSNVLESLDD